MFRPTACKYKSAVEPFILDKMSGREPRADAGARQFDVGNHFGRRRRGPRHRLLKMRRITDNLQVTLPEEALEYGFRGQPDL